MGGAIPPPFFIPTQRPIRCQINRELVENLLSSCRELVENSLESIQTESAERETAQKGRRVLPFLCEGHERGRKSLSFQLSFLSLLGTCQFSNFPQSGEGLELGSLNYRFRTVHKVLDSMQNEGFCCILNRVPYPRSKLPSYRNKKGRLAS